MGVRTITTSLKDRRKAVCHTVDTLQQETNVFLPDVQTRIIFLFKTSHFSSTLILSVALRLRQRYQLNKFLFHDAIWLMEPLAIQIMDSKPFLNMTLISPDLRHGQVRATLGLFKFKQHGHIIIPTHATFHQHLNMLLMIFSALLL